MALSPGKPGMPRHPCSLPINLPTEAAHAQQQKAKTKQQQKKPILLLRGHQILFAKACWAEFGSSSSGLLSWIRFELALTGVRKGSASGHPPLPSPQESHPTASPHQAYPGVRGAHGFGEATMHAPDRWPFPTVCPPSLAGLPQISYLAPQGRRP